MRGTRERTVRRGAAWALVAAAATTGGLVAPAGPAAADTTSIPGTMSTGIQSQSSFAVPVAPGTVPSAITAVLTMPEVVEGGAVVFRVNGRLALAVPSTLYRKVTIPVTASDVVADGTIGLTVSTQSGVAAASGCLPTAGVASLRKLALEYTGVEALPTSVGSFFPVTSPGIVVQIPTDADSGVITAGLTAVAALASRYDDTTPISLTTTAPEAATVAPPSGQRLVSLVAGRPGEVTTAITATSGIPTLTLTGDGDDLVNAARTLSSDALGLSGGSAENPSQQTKPRNTDTERSLSSLGVPALSITGYGSNTQELEIRQDSFGRPVDEMKVHLEGSHTAFSAGGGARLDVRANGSLVGSASLGDEAGFSLDLTIPPGKLRAVNDVQLTLTALAADGSPCTPPSIPPAEVDIDLGGSTVTVSPGTGDAKGFQLFPQIFEGTLPIALRSVEGRQASAAINAAALVATIQRAAGSPLDIQLMDPDQFLADDRSGLLVGALNSDSIALDAPLKLASTRLLDRDDETYEVTSQDPYAALESIDRNDRLVLMLGSWAPGNKAATGDLARKVVDYVVAQGWSALDGDLVIADDANPAFAAASRSLSVHQEVEQERSYAKWFAAVIAVLLLLLALQVVVAVRRDRRVARVEDDGPAYVEDEEYDVDDLGDVDDLDVLEYAEEREGHSGADHDAHDEDDLEPEEDEHLEDEDATTDAEDEDEDDPADGPPAK